MNCPRCGVVQAPGACVCHVCGTPIAGAPAQPPYPYAAPYAPACAPPPAYAASAGPKPLKSGADLAFGIIAIILGAIGIILWGLSFIALTRQFSNAYIYSESQVGMIMAVLGMAAFASALLLTSGIIACVSGRGGALAIVSAVINMLFFLLLVVGAGVLVNSLSIYERETFGAFVSEGEVSNVVVAMVIVGVLMFLVPALLVFIFVPVRASIRNKRVLALAAAAAGMYGAGVPYPPAYAAGYYPAQPQPVSQPVQE